MAKGCGRSKEAKAKSQRAMAAAHRPAEPSSAAWSVRKSLGFSAGFVGIGIEE